MPTSFPQFPHLSPEIRLMIWEASMPTIEAALYPFYPGLRDIRPLKEHERTDYHGSGSTTNCAGKIIFRDDLLVSHTLYAIPSLFVNSESHAAARRWMRKSGIRLTRFGHRAHGDWRDWTFRRLFDADRFGDAVYVSKDVLYKFLYESEDFQDHDFQYYDLAAVLGPAPRGEILGEDPWSHPIAIDYSLLEPDRQRIIKVICDFARMRKLSLILDSPEVFAGSRSEGWTFHPIPGEKFCWSADEGAFQLMSHDDGAYDRRRMDRLLKTFKMLMAEIAPDLRKVDSWATNRRRIFMKDHEEDYTPGDHHVGPNGIDTDTLEELAEPRITVQFVSIARK